MTDRKESAHPSHEHKVWNGQKKNLLLLTDVFPFGKGETFLFPELAILRTYFNISIATTDTTSELQSEYSDSFALYRINKSFSLTDKIRYLFLSCFSPILWSELITVLSGKIRLLPRIRSTLEYHMKALKYANSLDALHILEAQDIVYSYWHTYRLLGAGMALRRKGLSDICLVSRIHGYDLFNERKPETLLQSFQSVMDTYLTELHFVSKAGYEYYRQVFGFIPSCRYTVSRLGVDNEVPFREDNRMGMPFSIVSCSYAVPLKRIDLIIRALALIGNFPVTWTHIGGGPELESLRNLASEKLDEKENITFLFMGDTGNSAVHRFYRTQGADLFITTSSTEGGSPVSIQEAFSYGIPALATAVGGIPEMMEERNNGILLSDQPSPEEISKKIELFCEAKLNGTLGRFRSSAYETWRTLYDGKKNFHEYAFHLFSLCENL